MASPLISWPNSDGLSPLKARLYQGVQMMAETALEHWGEVEAAAKDLPPALAFTVGAAVKAGPRMLHSLAPRVHGLISRASDEQIRDALHTAQSVILSILDTSPTIEESAPDGNGHDGATNQEPAA